MTIRNTKSFKRWALAGAAATVFAAYAPAFAQDKQTYEFEIESQDLGRALTEFGIATGSQVLFNDKDINGVRTSGLEGAFTTAQAITALLDDTGIDYRVDTNGTLLVGNEYVRQTSSEQENGPFRVAQLDQEGVGAVARVSDRDDDKEDAVQDTIVVTGSRIGRSEFETLQPATIVGRDQIDYRASANIADILNEQAGFALPGSSPAGVQTQGAIGQSFADYLGLGAQRTLTLVNGHRFPSGAAPNGAGGLSVDLNSIPTSLIDRVETIAIGGAPIYGSDAISGTVNIIMKDDFDGLEYRGSFGISPEYGDAEKYHAGITWGHNFDNGRGNIVLFGEYSNSAGLREIDRPATELGLDFRAPNPALNSPFSAVLSEDSTIIIDSLNGGPLLTGNFRSFNVFGNGIPFDPSDPNSPLAQFDADGNLIPLLLGEPTGSAVVALGGDGFDLNDRRSLLTDLERFNANVFLNYDLTDSIRFKAEGWYARTEAEELINNPNFNSPTFGGAPANTYGNVGGGPVPVLLSNPFLPEATRIMIGDAIDFNNDGTPDNNIDTDLDGVFDAPGFWRYGSLADLIGDNPDGSNQSTYRAVLGLEGDALFANRDISWDVYYTYGRSVSKNRSIEIIQNNFEQAVLVTTDANGNPVCVDPSNGCAPINIVGTASAEAAAFATEELENTIINQQHVFGFNAGADLFGLPAGPVKAVVGFSYRKEQSEFDPSVPGRDGSLRFTLVPIEGKFSSAEFYGETLIPILSDDMGIPFVDTLELEGAVRHVDNSVAGKDVTWTFGGRYRPVPDVEFRGNLTESIRAPSITELFTPESQIAFFASDPCDARFVAQGNVPNVRSQNCAADSLPTNFESFIVSASQFGTVSGNQDLSSEVAKSWTAGVILRPSFIEGLTISADWLNIEIQNAIESLNATEILNACYDSANFPGEPACGLFDRAVDGQINTVRTGFVNVGLVEFSGLTAIADYRFELARYGDINLSANYLYTDTLNETPGSGNTNQQAGEIGRSKHRLNTNFVWRQGAWTWFNQVRWNSGAAFDNADAEFSRDLSRVDDWMLYNTGIGYEVNDSLTVQLNVDNVFNSSAPHGAIAAGAAGIQTYFPSILERYVTFSVRGRF